MSDNIAPIDPNVDPYGYIGFCKNSDGSVTRLPSKIPEIPSSSDLNNPFHLSKDVIINRSNNTSVRIFVPRKSFDSDPNSKLPIVVYFHGGGFVLCSAASAVFYGLYNGLTNEIPALVVSVDYRLAPEHRLPAAYEDSMEVLHWIKNSNDDWLTKYGDVSRCFLMGTSAGANVSFHIGLRVALCAEDLKPLVVKGLILHHPFLGGEKRLDSELRLVNDKVLPPHVSDVMWDLSLPIGADRDHEYCNLIASIKIDVFDRIKLFKWKILVTGCDGDPMVDRQMELVKKLEELDVSVVSKFEKGGFHGYDLFNPVLTKLLVNSVKEIVES